MPQRPARPSLVRRLHFVEANPGLNTEGQRALIFTFAQPDGGKLEVAIPAGQGAAVISHVALSLAWHEIHLQEAN